MNEYEVKTRIFEAICNNSTNLCDNGKYIITPEDVARHTNEVYSILFGLG